MACRGSHPGQSATKHPITVPHLFHSLLYSRAERLRQHLLLQQLPSLCLGGCDAGSTCSGHHTTRAPCKGHSGGAIACSTSLRGHVRLRGSSRRVQKGPELLRQQRCAHRFWRSASCLRAQKVGNLSSIIIFTDRHAKLILRTTVYARVAYGCCLRHGGKYLWKLAAVTMVPAPIVTGTLMYVFTCLVMCLGGGVMFCFRLSSKQTTKCVARSSAVACNLLAQPC